jgi:hypothetical protein
VKVGLYQKVQKDEDCHENPRKGGQLSFGDFWESGSVHVKVKRF